MYMAEEKTVKVFRQKVENGWINWVDEEDILEVFRAYSKAVVRELIERYVRLVGLKYVDGMIRDYGNNSVDEFAEKVACIIDRVSMDLATTVRIEKIIVP